MAAVVEHISLSHYAESAGQLALGGKSALDAAVHDDPHAVEIMPDSFALESFNQVGDSDIFFLAVFFYLREILERVDFGRLRVLSALNFYRTAADAADSALADDVSVLVKCREVERVGVGDVGRRHVEFYVEHAGREGLAQNSVRAVTFSCLCECAVENRFVSVRRRELVYKHLGGGLGSHGVRA